MKRRHLLVGVCAGCVGGITGCTAEYPTDPDDDGSNEGETQSFGGVDLDIEMPNEAAVGEEFDVVLTAENFGDAERTLTPDVQISIPGRETEIIEIDLQIPAGSSVSESITVLSDVLGEVTVTIASYDIVMRTDIGPLALTFGEYVDAEGIPEITLLKPEVSRYYRREVNGGVVRKEAATGTQFVLVELRVRNPSDAMADFPDLRSFVAQIGDRDYEPMSTDLSNTDEFVEPVVGKELDLYSPSENSSSEQNRTPQYESRIVPFEVRSEDLSGGIEIHVEWSVGPTAGDTAVHWSS